MFHVLPDGSERLDVAALLAEGDDERARPRLVRATAWVL